MPRKYTKRAKPAESETRRGGGIYDIVAALETAAGKAVTDHEENVAALRSARKAVDGALSKLAPFERHEIALDVVEVKKTRPMERAAPAAEKTPRGQAKPCCGSTGTRHKASCGSATVKQEGKLPPDHNDGLNAFECMSDGHKWRDARDIDEMKEAGCPDCDSHMIVQQ